jgi:hypothetical protein
LGLRELGIEAEFGLKSLSVPKRLWKGKSTAEDRTAPDRCVLSQGYIIVRLTLLS